MLFGDDYGDFSMYLTRFCSGFLVLIEGAIDVLGSVEVGLGCVQAFLETYWF